MTRLMIPLIILLTLCLAATAIFSAVASAANGVAMTAAAGALQTSQCVNGLAIASVLITSITALVGYQRLHRGQMPRELPRAKPEQSLIFPRQAETISVLPDPEEQIIDVPDRLFADWGFDEEQ